MKRIEENEQKKPNLTSNKVITKCSAEVEAIPIKKKQN